MARVLIIDDDLSIRNSLMRCFAGMGHEVLLAGGIGEGLVQAATGVDVIYLDLGLPDGDGKQVIDDLAATPSNPEIIVITGLGGNYGAQETLASGAWDYISKPATPQQVKASLQSALAYRRDRTASAAPGGQGACAFQDCGIIGESPAIARAKRLIARAAESGAGVLILGETGSGKELAAKAIHANSCRRDGPFVVVDCSNLSESLIESLLYGHVKGAFTGAHADHRGLVAEADGGTLFLDEVGELPLGLQKSFLRVLQEHRFRAVGAVREQASDFRLVAATNRDLEAMTRADAFRSDLLFRLRTVEVALPPLRDRGADVLLLAEHCVRRACARYSLAPKRLAPQLESVLRGYPWPGNVRELGNVMESAVIEAGADPVIYPKHLPGAVRLSTLDARRRPESGPAPVQERPVPSPEAIPSYEEHKAARDRDYFQALMEASGHDVPTASRISGLSVPSVYRRLSILGVSTRVKPRG